MTKLPLSPVRYYDTGDIYVVDVDNRPIVDLATNIDTINSALESLGFISYIVANPETEPAGGFKQYDCVSVRENGLLYPIDISLPTAITDYRKYPIYLVNGVTESNNIRTYECLAFSASLTLVGRVNRFMPESVGRKLKVSPTGTLVDEVYFDLYYSDYPYQSLYVGKVLSANSISFGGSQVSAHISGVDFVGRGINDTNTGLTTIVRNADDNHTVHRSVLVSNDPGNAAYPYVEYNDSTSIENGGIVGVYFSNSALNTTETGEFDISKPLETYLNTVHFRTESISPNTSASAKYGAAGVNVKSLLEFSNVNLLHSADYSTQLGEASQTMATSLQFTPPTGKSAVASFPCVSGSIGTSLENGIPVNLCTPTSVISAGIGFDNLVGNALTGPMIATIQDTNPSLPEPSETEINTPRLSAMAGSKTLLIANRSADVSTEAPANMALVSDGYLMLSAKKGAFYNPISYESGGNTEIATVGLIEKHVEALRNDTLGNQVPLTGTTDDSPMTGCLAMDVSQSSTNLFFKLKGTNAANIQASHPITFASYDSINTLIPVRGRTPAASTEDPGTEDDFVTRKFLASALAGSSSVSYTKRNASEQITGSWSFNNGLNIVEDMYPTLVLSSKKTGHGVTGRIATTADYVSVVSEVDRTKLIGLRARTPISADGSDAVVNVAYVNQEVLKLKRQVGWAAWNQTPAYDAKSILSMAIPSSQSDLYKTLITPYTDALGTYYKNTSKNIQVFKVSCTVTATGVNLAKILTLESLNNGAKTTAASAALGSTGSSQTLSIPGVASASPVAGKKTFFSRFIDKSSTTNSSATITHTVRLTPGDGFRFTLTDVSVNAVESAVNAFGSVELITTEI